MNSIKLLLSILSEHTCTKPSFKIGVCTSKQAIGRCQNCQQHFGVDA